MPTKNFSDFCPGSWLEGRAEIWEIFSWHFGRNDDIINSFWIQLTFRTAKNILRSKNSSNWQVKKIFYLSFQAFANDVFVIKKKVISCQICYFFLFFSSLVFFHPIIRQKKHNEIKTILKLYLLIIIPLQIHEIFSKPLIFNRTKERPNTFFVNFYYHKIQMNLQKSFNSIVCWNRSSIIFWQRT